MTFVDEEIAKMLRRQRMQEKNTEQQEKEEKEAAMLDEKEIIKGIEKGSCTIFDRTFLFQPHKILKGKAQIYLPMEELEIKVDDQEIFTAIQMDEARSFQYTLNGIKQEFEPLSVYKENMKKNLKKTNMQFKWIEEGCILKNNMKIQYIEFINSTGLGTIHNHMWFIMTPYGQMICNLNYNHEDEKYWRPMTKALMKLVEIY